MQTYPSLSKGVTLVELLIALFILILIIGIAVPGFNHLTLANTRASAVNTYLGALALARHQAVIARSITAICPLDENNVCIDDWNRPVSIFPDTDKNQQPDNNEVWRVIQAPGTRLHVYSRTAGTGSIHFGPDGLVHGTTGSLVICPEDVSSGQMTYIAVNRGGRARQVSDNDGDGSISLSWGGQVACP